MLGSLIVSGTVTGWFVSKDAPNFSFIQGMASLVVIAVIVLVRWRSGRRGGPTCSTGATSRIRTKAGLDLGRLHIAVKIHS